MSQQKDGQAAHPTNTTEDNAAIMKNVKSVELKEKFKQRRKTMQQVRTNSCSLGTVQNLAAMDPKLQSQVLNQVRTKKQKQDLVDRVGGESKTTDKKKSRPSASRRPSARKQDKKDKVPQSTEDIAKSLKEAESNILITAIEKLMADLIRPRENETPEETEALESLRRGSEQGVGFLRRMFEFPELGQDIKTQILTWAKSGSVPHNESIGRFVEDIFSRYMKIKNPSAPPRTFTFNHDLHATNPVESVRAPSSDTHAGTADRSAQVAQLPASTAQSS